jgi:putative redox protein
MRPALNTMVQINLNYQAGLRCSATHAPSGNVLTTDAPVDNNGKGEAFSPTDLVATALGACMATVMGIVAERKEISLEGMNVEVRKHMSEDSPRRISKLEVDINMPLPDSHPERKLLESAARGCPVHQSLHPDIETVFKWTWI